MANYTYLAPIESPFGDPTRSAKDRMGAFAPLLDGLVMNTLWEPWRLSPCDDDELTVLVVLSDLDVGFSVSLGDRQIEFRHPMSMFLRWAQGCVEEGLSEYLRRDLSFDASDRIKKPGTSEYRKYRTFKDFAFDFYGESAEHHKNLVPEGFWEWKRIELKERWSPTEPLRKSKLGQ